MTFENKRSNPTALDALPPDALLADGFSDQERMVCDKRLIVPLRDPSDADRGSWVSLPITNENLDRLGKAISHTSSVLEEIESRRLDHALEQQKRHFTVNVKNTKVLR